MMAMRTDSIRVLGNYNVAHSSTQMSHRRLIQEDWKAPRLFLFFPFLSSPGDSDRQPHFRTTLLKNYNFNLLEILIYKKVKYNEPP